jgi:hydroxyacylglutathione hydrolase
MILKGLVTGMFQENCFVAGCERSREALVVDPGDDLEHILATLESHQLTTKLIVCTHTHVDHIGAVQPLRDATQAPLAMHRDAFAAAGDQSSLLAYMTGQPPAPIAEPEQLIDGGDELEIGDLRFQVLYCPGGDGRVLLQSIRDKLLVLPDDTLVLPGHGPTSTIGEEKQHNPFILYPRAMMGINLD